MILQLLLLCEVANNMPVTYHRFKKITNLSSWTNPDNVIDDDDTTYGSLSVSSRSSKDFVIYLPENLNQLPENAGINSITIQTLCGTDKYINVVVVAIRRYLNGQFVDNTPADYNTVWLGESVSPTSVKTYAGTATCGLCTIEDLRSTSGTALADYTGLAVYIRVKNTSYLSAYKFHPRYFKLVVDYELLANGDGSKVWAIDSLNTTTTSKSTSTNIHYIFQNYIPYRYVTRINVKFEYATSDYTGNLEYQFKAGNSTLYTNQFSMDTTYKQADFDIPLSSIEAGCLYIRKNGGFLMSVNQFSSDHYIKYYMRNIVLTLYFKYGDSLNIYVGNKLVKQLYISLSNNIGLYIGNSKLQ